MATKTKKRGIAIIKVNAVQDKIAALFGLFGSFSLILLCKGANKRDIIKARMIGFK